MELIPSDCICPKCKFPIDSPNHNLGGCNVHDTSDARRTSNNTTDGQLEMEKKVTMDIEQWKKDHPKPDPTVINTLETLIREWRRGRIFQPSMDGKKEIFSDGYNQALRQCANRLEAALPYIKQLLEEENGQKDN